MKTKNLHLHFSIRRSGLALVLGLLVAPLASAAQDGKKFNFETVATFGRIGVADDEAADTVAGVEIRLPHNWHGIRPWLGTSVSDNGTWFAGAGFIYDIKPSPDWTVTLGTGPFYYESMNDELGFDLEFYSFVEVTRHLRNEVRLGLRIGHLSNAGLGRINPGTENVTLVAVIPLTRDRLRSLWSGESVATAR
ncbi:MAG TPA: acyloxyacyl hydrolase [Opitutaceae bacterium]|nr:acyloxyacyl hydrolase [Opitutaceae bacterium]